MLPIPCSAASRLWIFIGSWGVPLALDGWRSITCLESLLIWLIPLSYLWPLFVR